MDKTILWTSWHYVMWREPAGRADRNGPGLFSYRVTDSGCQENPAKQTAVVQQRGPARVPRLGAILDGRGEKNALTLSALPREWPVLLLV